MSNTNTATAGSKGTKTIRAELEDLRSLSADMAGYVHSILSAIETLSSMPGKQPVISDLAAAGQYIMSSLDGSIFTACNQLAETSKELH